MTDGTGPDEHDEVDPSAGKPPQRPTASESSEAATVVDAGAPTVHPQEEPEPFEPEDADGSTGADGVLAPSPDAPQADDIERASAEPGPHDQSEPEESEPDTTEPDAAEPEATEPETTEPDATAPDADQEDESVVDAGAAPTRTVVAEAGPDSREPFVDEAAVADEPAAEVEPVAEAEVTRDAPGEPVEPAAGASEPVVEPAQAASSAGAAPETRAVDAADAAADAAVDAAVDTAPSAIDVPEESPAGAGAPAEDGEVPAASEVSPQAAEPEADAASWVQLAAALRIQQALDLAGVARPAPTGGPAGQEDPVGQPTESVTALAVGPSSVAAELPAPVASDAPAAAPESAQEASPATTEVLTPVPAAPAPATPAPAPAASDPVATVPPADADAPAADAGSPLDVFEEQQTARRWPRRLLVTLGVVVVLGAAYVGASYALADRVPRGATVAGVDIGGLSADAAVTRLQDELGDLTSQPVDVVANDVQAEIDPTVAGLVLDPEATVDELTGVDLARPQALWQHLVGVGAQTPVTEVDEDALTSALTSLTTSLSLAPVDGAIVFADGAPHATDAVDGWEVDLTGAAQALRDGWLVGERPLVLPTLVVEPSVTQEVTDRALAAARDVTSAPVGVTVADRLATLTPQALASAASYAPQDGELVLTMDGEALVADVLDQLPDLLTASADAHFEFQNDAPVIVPGTPGTTLDPEAVAASVAEAVHASVRTAAVELVESDPAESTAELEALGITEIVSEFSTPLNSEPRRTVNITNGASKISGKLIRPDETFSLTEALGPIDAEHGFVQAGAIVSGEHVDAWGGGLSQVSTTTYNAAYLAGFEDIEHQPHSEWFTRYPEGREATLFTGTLDMQWKNNTPYGALVQAWVADGRVYVRIWGTKYWRVESETSARSGVVAPTTVYSQSPTCEPSSAGNPGFTVTVTRRTYLGEELKATESNTWRYKPQNKVICGAAPTTP